MKILSQHFAVEVMARCTFRSLRHLIPAVARQLASQRYSLLYIWFAEPYDSPYLVLLARLLGVKSVVVVGGYDVARLPSLNYGALSTRRGALKVRIALTTAHTVVAVSRLLRDEIRQLGRRRKTYVVYPGVDCKFFTPPHGGREQLVVTVATVSGATWQLKGLDVFAKCSRLLPDVRFAILGPCPDPEVGRAIRVTGGRNLTVVSRRLTQEELLGWYRRAAVYAQLSVRESFGLAMAEAMSCACAPVATAVGALPEVVGNTGSLVRYGDHVGAAGAIECALKSGRGGFARRRVQELYRVENRESHLAQVVRGVLSAP